MVQERPEKRPARRVSPDYHVESGGNWESAIDRQIREAMEQGKFDNLPLHGKPLPKQDNPYAADMALAFDILQNAGYAPPWIEADKEVRRLMGEMGEIMRRAATGGPPSGVARARDRKTVADLVQRVNRDIATVNAQGPTLRQHRPALVLDDELTRYEDACRR